MAKKVVKNQMKGFVNFIREQGVVGLAIGFILGGAVSAVVKSLVTDIIEPAIGMFVGYSDGLKSLVFGPITYGNFITVLIDFLIVAAVVYFGFKALGVSKLDKEKK